MSAAARTTSTLASGVSGSSASSSASGSRGHGGRYPDRCVPTSRIGAVPTTAVSDAAFQAHMDSKHVAAAIAGAVPLLAVPPDIRRYRRLR